jgi:hypothetical protein
MSIARGNVGFIALVTRDIPASTAALESAVKVRIPLYCIIVISRALLNDAFPFLPGTTITTQRCACHSDFDDGSPRGHQSAWRKTRESFAGMFIVECMCPFELLYNHSKTPSSTQRFDYGMQMLRRMLQMQIDAFGPSDMRCLRTANKIENLQNQSAQVGGELEEDSHPGKKTKKKRVLNVFKSIIKKK